MWFSNDLTAAAQIDSVYELQRIALISKRKNNIHLKTTDFENYIGAK